jgi:hypothetical protein
MKPIYFIGLDLGKRMDHPALAVLERLERSEWEFDPVQFKCNHRVTVTYNARWMARLRTETAYPELVRKLIALIRGLAGLGEVCLVIDASGAGRPLLALLRNEELPVTLVAVTIESGSIGINHATDGVWRLGLTDLLSGL